MYHYMDYFKLFMCLRVVLAIVVLYYLPIPLTAKILLIMFFDNIDGRFVKRLGIHNHDHTLTKEYQIHDKIADLLGYIIVLHYLYKEKVFEEGKLMILSTVLVYRLIGDYIFFKEKNRKVLFYFPNIYEKLVLLWAIFNDTGLNVDKYVEVLIIIFITMFKTYHEFFLHYSDDNHKGFKPIFGKFLKGKMPVMDFIKVFKKTYIY